MVARGRPSGLRVQAGCGLVWLKARAWGARERRFESCHPDVSTVTRDCMCSPTPPADKCRKGTCKYGYCVEWKCPDCYKAAFGFGPVMCRCDWNRQQYFPDMMPKHHVAIKENTMRKQKRFKRAHKQ